MKQIAAESIPLKLAIILVQILFLSTLRTMAKLCYSCSGVCHNSASCNCQMGSCESNYCFIEKKPTEVSGMFRLTKGCVKRPSRTRPGCDFDHFPDHIRCVCQGDFCNDSVLLRFHQGRRNVTCQSCPENRPDCSDTCQGQWCHEMVNTGATGCGYGPPSLPYFYETTDLLHRVPKVCITMSRGSGSQHKYCICNTNLCNNHRPIPSEQDKSLTSYISSLISGGARRPEKTVESSTMTVQQMKSRSLNAYYASGMLPNDEFYECVSCDLTTEQNSLTSACKQNRCTGQFCVYVMQRTIATTYGAQYGAIPRINPHHPHAIIHERQGCINVTDKTYVQLGCSHKWMNNEEEELYCACKGNLCNQDISLISAANDTSMNGKLQLTLLILLAISAWINRCLL